MSAQPGGSEAEFVAGGPASKVQGGVRSPVAIRGRPAVECRPWAAGSGSPSLHRTETEAGGLRGAVMAMAVIACVLMLLLNVFRRERYTGDEGFYGVTALNMLEAPDYVVRTSYFPLGDFAADKDGFAHPPFNSYFYAVSLALAGGSRMGPEVLSALNFAALLFLVFKVAAPFDRRAAWMSVALLAASPAIAGYYGMLEAEPLMTTFGIASLACCLRADLHSGRRWLFLGGLSLGMSFALKLWLFGPLVLAVGLALLIAAVRSRAGAADCIVGAGIFATGFVVAPGAHLLAIAVVHPEDLRFWLHNIYFGVFTHSGISGSKVGGSSTPVAWMHPVWYYGAALYRDHFFLAPAFVFGVPALWTELRQRASRRSVGPLSAVVVAGFAGIVPLSLLKVKEPLYVLTCSVFLYLIAALCLAALARRLAAGRGLGRLTLWGGTAIIAGLVALVGLARVRGLQPENVTVLFVIAHTATFAVGLAVAHWADRRSRAKCHLSDDTSRVAGAGAGVVERAVYACCAAAVLFGFGWSWSTREPRAAAIADVLAPAIGGDSPRALTFIASNFKCFQYLTFRRGMYWHELPQGQALDELMPQPQYRQVRAFVLGPEDLARPAAKNWLGWLEENAIEKTAEVDARLGSKSGWRVFVGRQPTPTDAPGRF